MLYRYELDPTKTKYPNTGIIAGLREFFDRETGMKLVDSFDKYLSVPPSELDQNGIYSFFTEKGIRYFKNDVDAIIKAYSKLGIVIIRIIINEDEISVDYADEFQVLGRYI